jgi:poly(A) polymerase
MLTDRSWLDAPETRTLIAAFDAAAIDCRFVGGVVRDSLLGRPISDVVTRALMAVGLKVIPTGIAHGTVTAIVGQRHYEITTLRRDVETDGRHAIVAFTDDWRADAARRDFTMNALYADRDGRITDFFGGVADARAGRVRFIGDPALRIAEDALRILRFFRFQAWYGVGDPDPDGLTACAIDAPMIGRLSTERVRDEVFKLLRAPDPAPVWRAMLDAGIVAHVTPAATRWNDLGRLTRIERDLHLSADPLRRLAALVGPNQDAAALKSTLKLSNRDAEHLASLDVAPARLAWLERGEFARALYGAEPAWLRDAALLAHVRSGRPETPILVALHGFMATWREPRFPLTGADLTARGVTPGPEMGRRLKQIEDWWVAGSLTASREECLAELDRLQGRE